MRACLFALVLFAMLAPTFVGCGGGEQSYKDRQGTIDPATVPAEDPEKPAP